MALFISLFCVIIFLFSCAETSTPNNETASQDLEQSYNEISKFLQKIVIDNLDQSAKEEFSKSYKHLSNEPNVNFFKNKIVYLFYEGLPFGGMWSKPGAKNFGGIRVGTVDFNAGPVKADIVAHVELPGKRNYFYAILRGESDLEGWVGRPYVMMDKEGKIFLMPNPITGEKVRDVIDVKLDVDFIRGALAEKPTTYIQEFNNIPWSNCYCTSSEEIRRQGYDMYLDALENGHSQVDDLVSSYLATNF